MTTRNIRKSISAATSRSVKYKEQMQPIRRELANCIKDYREEVRKGGEYSIGAVFALGRIHGLTSGISDSSHQIFMTELRSKF